MNYRQLLPRKAIDLALCGDVGRPFMDVSGSVCHYKSFLAYAASTWRHVFLITGNHCYYGHRKSETDERIRSYCDNYQNLHFLSDSVYVFTAADDVPFHGIWGSTLWTNVTDMAFAQMNDHRIRPTLSESQQKYTRTSSRLTAHTIRGWHESHKAALSKALQEPRPGGKKWVIMTHHAPRPPPDENLHTHADASSWSAYINELPPDLFDKEKIAVWLCGHLHAHFDAMVNGIRYVSNCMGYPGEKHVGYKDSFVIEY